MRIGILHNAYRYRGGEDRVVEAETDLLRNAGHHVSQMIIDNRDAFASLGPTLASMSRTVSGWNRHAGTDIALWARREQLDLVHVHNIFPMITPAGPAALAALRVPVVMTLHNFRLICAGGTLTRNGVPCRECIGGGTWRGVVRGCYRGSRAQSASWELSRRRANAGRVWADGVSRFIAPSPHVRDAHVEAGFDAGRMVVRPHFTDLDTAPARSRAGALVVGRIQRGKGVIDLVRAWPASAPVLTVVGTGPDEAETRATAGGNVRFTGHLTREGVAREMTTAGVLISASTLPETFGLTPVEAAACWLPTVAFASGGIANVIEDRITGRLVDPGNTNELVQAAVHVLASPHLQRCMGEAARARYERLYSPAAGLDSLERIYRSALAPTKEGAA